MHNRFFLFFFISRLREALRPSTAKAKVNLFILFSRCVLFNDKCFWEVHFCLHVRQTVVAPKRNEHRFKCLQVSEYKSCNANLLFIKVTAVFAKGRMSQVRCFLFFFTVSDDECEGCVGQPLCMGWLTCGQKNKQTKKFCGKTKMSFWNVSMPAASVKWKALRAQMGKRNPTRVLLLNYVKNTVLNRCLKPLKRTEYCKWTLLMWFSHNSEEFVLLEVQRLISEYVKCPS